MAGLSVATGSHSPGQVGPGWHRTVPKEMPNVGRPTVWDRLGFDFDRLPVLAGE